MNATQFRLYNEPFRGRVYEYGNYRIRVNYFLGEFLNYTCEHAGELFAKAHYFEDAVEKCQRHAAKGGLV